MNKKKIVLILIILIILPILINIIQVISSGSKPKNFSSDVLVIIDNRSNDCEHQSLTLYKDGTYQLYTAHAETLFFMNESITKLTRSKTGVYDFDISNIIAKCTKSADAIIDMDHLPEYELRYYDEEGNPEDYYVEYGQTNEELEKFFKKHNINLNKCSTKDYLYYLIKFFYRKY